MPPFGSIVSVVIPAYQAAATIDRTLAALAAQTMAAWEVVVVDDGSTDGTAERVRSAILRDQRIRLIAGAHQGVSAARNVGIGAARSPLLLFLDADDEITPTHLERLADVLHRESTAAIAYSGWARIAPDGSRVDPANFNQSGDLFHQLGRRSLFPIHSVLVRRAVVEAVGRFDQSLATCEDWDLWQRIARTGATFLAVPDISALYRMQGASLSIDAAGMLRDGLVVIARGHGEDPRVQHPDPTHARGLPADGLPTVRYGYACWCAGLQIGCGQDPVSLLGPVDHELAPNLDPVVVGGALFEAILLPRCLRPDQMVPLWPSVAPVVEAYLTALERRSEAPQLGRRALLVIADLVMRHSRESGAITVGTTRTDSIELTEPIRDLVSPTGIERFRLSLTLGGTRLGATELAVFHGMVPGSVIADAASADVHWRMLGGFFAGSIYGADLTLRREGQGVAILRGEVFLAWLPAGLAWPATTDWLQQAIGWTVFLQELWGLPTFAVADFYDPNHPAVEFPLTELVGTVGPIEVTEPLPTVVIETATTSFECRIAGVPVGWITATATDGRVTAQALRAAITTTCGLELCRLAVREGLLGRPLAARGTLRQRLAEAAMTRGNATSAMARPDRPHAEPIPGQTSALLGRHPHGAIGTAVCRRGHLPFGCLEDVAALAAETGQPFSRYEAAAGSILYLPELLGQPVGSDRSDHPAPQARGYDRHYFESIFSRSRDPWVYRSPYEQLKYQQTLDLIPATAGRGLELACAEGDFTEMFAGRVGQLVAGDISQLALDRAKRRCDGLSNVEFRRLDLMVDPLPSGLDAIVCSEVLYFVGLDRLPTVAAKLAAALALGGVLVLAHANMTVDAPDQPGFDWGLLYGALTIGRTFAADPDLRFVKELQSRHYRIQLFRKDTRSSGEAPRGHEPESIEAIPSAEPIATVAATFRPASAAASRAEAPIETWRLPILMYHRVAPAGSPRTRRYRVSPGDFDRQMGYLADSGFYTVSTDQWREAIHYRTPLPGRAMIITFDDGYRDFAEHAWPVLRRHGLGATMFIVSDRVGTANAWDWMYRDEVPLLDWAEIRDLASQGVEFGSHSATHRSLTAAPPEEAARELLRSRLILSRELGRPVSAVAYPYGDADPVVQQMAGHVGYLYGFTCRWGRARHDDPLLGLPRIEVDGTGSFADFVAKLA